MKIFLMNHIFSPLLKGAGAAYLLYRGVQLLLRKASEVSDRTGEVAGDDRWTIHRQLSGVNSKLGLSEIEVT